MPNDEINLILILQGCLNDDRNSQRRLYEQFYGYAMNICLRYSKNREEAVEILNDAFLKVFLNLGKYNPEFPFKGWLRRIIINSAIDYYRKNNKHPDCEELTPANVPESEEMPLPKLAGEEDLLPVLRKLSPAYRIIFNLFVMEDYSHREIAEMLGIDVRTSRSNLVRAKENIRALMQKKSFKPVNLN